MKRLSLVFLSLILALGLCIPSSALLAFAEEAAQPVAPAQPADVVSDAAEGARVEPGPRSEGAPDASNAPAAAPAPAAEAPAAPAPPAPAAEAQPSPAADVPAAPAPEAPAPAAPPAPAPADDAADTGSYDISVTLAGEQDAFYGGEWVTIYNNVSISGNDTILADGSYTVISLPKDAFSKPSSEPNVNVSTTFERFKDLEVVETDDAYLVKTYHKQLTGGYTAGTPIKINFIPRQVINGSGHLIKQELFDASGTKLAESQLPLHSKAEIESLGVANYPAERLVAEVDASFVTKPGTYKEFYPNVSATTENYNDPRDRRIYAEIPAGSTIKPDTGWTYDAGLGAWYKDMKRDEFVRTSWQKMQVDLDVSGIDLSSYNSPSKVKDITVTYSIQPVVDGVVQGDLVSAKASCTRAYYILTEDPSPPATSLNADSMRWAKTIDADYKPISDGTYASWSNTIAVPYPLEQLGDQRIRYSHNLITRYGINNPHNDEATREVRIKSSRMLFNSYVSPAQVRITITDLKAEEAANLKAKLEGTKAYGIAQDGSETLLSSNVPIVTSATYVSSFTAEGYQSFAGGDAYQSIRFEYPETLSIVGQDQIKRFTQSVLTDVVCNLKEDARSGLVERLEAGGKPQLPGTHDEAYTDLEAKFVTVAGHEARSSDHTLDGYSVDTFTLQYDSIIAGDHLWVSNGSQFFANDTLTTKVSYAHTRNGRFADANTPENINIYYLVPDGLEPAEEGGEASAQWESIRVQRGYKPGYNLVIAKPKGYQLPLLASRSALSAKVYNPYDLNFTATERLAIGAHNIEAALLIDNNKLDFKDGKQHGILQYDTPAGLFDTLTNDAANRSDNRAKYTYLGSTEFRMYPPKVLYGLKSVKMAGAPDSAYASSVGEAATIGDEVDYQCVVVNNSTRDIDQLTLIDVLPYAGDKAIVANQEGEYRSRGSQFTTELISVEASDMFDIYYSVDAVKATTAENMSATWSAAVDDMSRVTMIKAVLKPGKTIKQDEAATLVTHNKIANDPTLKDGQKAHNSFALTVNEGTSFTETLKTEVAVHYPKKDVTLRKVDAGNQEKLLPGAVYSLYFSEGDVLVQEGITTDRNGVAVLPNLLIGRAYYLVETTAPEGYELPAAADNKLEFVVSTDVGVITATNDIARTSVAVTKVWDDVDNQDGSRPESVSVQLYADGASQGDAIVLSEENEWKHTWADLVKNTDGAPIAYTVEEVVVPEGYAMKMEGDQAAGFTITNTHEPKLGPPTKPEPEPVVPIKPEPVVPVKPTPEPKPDPGTPGKPAQATPSPQPTPVPKKGGLSKTGDATVDLALGIMAAAVVSCGAAALARRRSTKH